MKLEMPQQGSGELMGNVSKHYRQTSLGRWQHIQPEPYKKDSDSYKGMVRFELVGKRGESTCFHTRYFEIEKGGYSSYERHQHEHVVVVQRGRGEVRLGCEIKALFPGDVLYIGPHDPHQFRNPNSEEPFGFLCMVSAIRDLPVALEGTETCQICE